MEIEEWLTVAARLGATHARVSAGGQSPTDESLARGAGHLIRLSTFGEASGVRVVTENWHAMMPGSREVLKLIELTDNRVPLCLDFGNWSGPTKYAELAAIAPHAVTVHAKCSFTADGVADAEDFRRCLDILRAADFAGTIALIYDSPPADEWRYLDEQLRLARAVYDGI
jgi:sugar phosphate isomerase/epimerase